MPHIVLQYIFYPLKALTLIYSFYCLIKDKKWYITGGISLLLYVAAGSLCQHALNTQQNAVFELAHSTMLAHIGNGQYPQGNKQELPYLMK